jgi:hypothetical protein
VPGTVVSLATVVARQLDLGERAHRIDQRGIEQEAVQLLQDGRL